MEAAKEVIEDCPVCETKNTFIYKAGFPDCTRCGWFPLQMPYDEYDIEQGKVELQSNQLKIKS